MSRLASRPSFAILGVEFFARSARPGFIAWGNEAPR